MILYYLTGTLLLLWIYVLWSRRAFYKLIWKMPGPLGYPIVGMAHRLIRREGNFSVHKKLNIVRVHHKHNIQINTKRKTKIKKIVKIKK